MKRRTYAPGCDRRSLAIMAAVRQQALAEKRAAEAAQNAASGPPSPVNTEKSS